MINTTLPKEINNWFLFQQKYYGVAGEGCYNYFYYRKKRDLSDKFTRIYAYITFKNNKFYFIIRNTNIGNSKIYVSIYFDTFLKAKETMFFYLSKNQNLLK